MPGNTGQLQNVSKALHNQELHDVMFELERSKDPDARQLFTMAEQGRVHPLKESELRELCTKKIGLRHPNNWKSIALFSNETWLPDFDSTAERVRDVLKQDIGGENFFRFVPSQGSPEKDAEAAERLINNVGNSMYCEPGSIIHMNSPTFDHILSNVIRWSSDGVLDKSAFRMTVAPAGEVFELGHYEHRLVTTLLTGTKIWVVYPPLRSNLDILRKAYEEPSVKQFVRMPREILSRLQHGVVIVQKQGQSLSIPPFWSNLSFCTESCTSGEQFIASAVDYMDRIRNMDVFLALNHLWKSKEQEQTHLVNYVTELANHFSMIARNEVDNFQTDQITIELCRAWMRDAKERPEKDVYPEVDIQGWALKPQNADLIEETVAPRSLMDQIVSMCELIECHEQKTRVEHIFQKAWVYFLDERRKKKPECRLCRERIEHMQGPGTRSQRLEQHFYDVHWGRRP